MRERLLDIVGIGGFAMMGVGLWLYSPALSLATCGGLMLALAVFGILRPTRKGD